MRVHEIPRLCRNNGSSNYPSRNVHMQLAFMHPLFYNMIHTYQPIQSVFDVEEDVIERGFFGFRFPISHPQPLSTLTTLGVTAAVRGTRRKIKDLWIA